MRPDLYDSLNLEITLGKEAADSGDSKTASRYLETALGILQRELEAGRTMTSADHYKKVMGAK